MPESLGLCVVRADYKLSSPVPNRTLTILELSLSSRDLCSTDLGSPIDPDQSCQQVKGKFINYHQLSYSILFQEVPYIAYIIGCLFSCGCCLCIVNIIILLTIINLYQRLEINTIIVDQLYSYFSSVVTDYIYGNDTIDEKESNKNV